MIITIALIAAGAYFSSHNTAAAILCYFFAVWVFPMKLTSYILTLKSIMAILLVIFAAKDRLFNNNSPAEQITVTFIDVGQGDSTLIQLPDNEVILIDAGTQDNSGTVSRILKDRHISEIDHLIGTHPHADHIGGLADIIYEFKVKEYIQPDTGSFNVPENYTLQRLNTALTKKHISVRNAVYGDIIAEGDNWTAEVLSPRKDAVFEDLNDYSLIIKVRYGKTAFLFTGDAGYLAELELLNEDISCDVLKVGHHGSFGSSSTAFLAETSPSIGVISVGKDNDSNLPNDYVLQRLTEEGIQVLRTDELGTITIVSDGHSCEVLKN